MTIKLEKEVAWINEKSVTKWFVWVDSNCVEIAYNEEEALRKYDNVKANYVSPSREIIKAEEI